jgi:hypothetical protein
VPDPPIYRRSPARGALRQCEILSHVLEIRIDIGAGVQRGTPSLNARVHPYVLVLSQDCDLDWDYRARSPLPGAVTVAEERKIPAILLCEVIAAANLRARPDINSSLWNTVKQNKNERYQFLEQVPAGQDAVRLGLPELALDFKRYFTIPAEQLYYQLRYQRLHRSFDVEVEEPRIVKAYRRCCVTSPYAEHLASRFAYFQSRIALPADHYSEPG